MPRAREHREKADLNRTFLDSIRDTAPPEWVVTVAFYLALHLVERLAARDDIHNETHQDRLNYLVRAREHRAIHSSFSALYDASLIARYGTANRFRRAYPGTAVAGRLLGEHLAAVERHARTYFDAQDAREAPPPG